MFVEIEKERKTHTQRYDGEKSTHTRNKKREEKEANRISKRLRFIYQNKVKNSRLHHGIDTQIIRQRNKNIAFRFLYAYFYVIAVHQYTAQGIQ